MSLNGKVALVTGASRGIGRAIAEELGKAGAIVAGTATTESGAQAITEFFAQSGIKGSGFCLDVGSSEAVDAVLVKIEQVLGSAPLILVNNAGITRDNLLMRMKDDEWESVINTNLTSLFRVCKGTLRAMTKARWGRIVNISSVVASSGNPGQTNYAASKAAVEGFTRSLAREIGSRGITVNAIAPGFIDTDMTKALNEKQIQMLMAQIPLARFGKPEEIGAVAGFLVSDAGGYITGETIQVNGGMYMA